MVAAISGVEMKVSRILALVFALVAIAYSTYTAESQSKPPWSQRAANAVIARWPDGRFSSTPAKWNYELGTLLEGMDSVWLNTVDHRYFNYIKKSVDQFVTPD